MKIVVYNTKNKEYTNVLNLCYKGLLKINKDVRIEYENVIGNEDIAIFWGSWKENFVRTEIKDAIKTWFNINWFRSQFITGKPSDRLSNIKKIPRVLKYYLNRDFNRYNKLKNRLVNEVKLSPVKRLIVLEQPLIGRNLEGQQQYFRIGFDHFMNNKAVFANPELNDNRWDLIAESLGIEIKPWRKTGTHILVVLQSPHDASLDGLDIEKWCSDTVTKIRSLTDRPIIIRPHPLRNDYNMKIIRSLINKLRNVQYVNPKNTFASNNLEDCWCVITYSSGFSVEALIEGIPVISLNNGNFTYEVTSHDLNDIEHPPMLDRSKWLNRLSYTQWDMDEIACGLPFKYLLDNLTESRIF